MYWTACASLAEAREITKPSPIDAKSVSPITMATSPMLADIGTSSPTTTSAVSTAPMAPPTSEVGQVLAEERLGGVDRAPHGRCR